jgi:REP element-mobilizing transposase RayT
MRRFKSLTAREINQLHGTSGTDVWQPGFHDRALRTEDDLPAHARYIVANPMRARIVRHVSEYPFWDAIWL